MKRKGFDLFVNFIPIGFRNQNKPRFPLWSWVQLQTFWGFLAIYEKSYLLRRT